MKLWDVMFVQTILGEDSHVIKRSMVEGIIIFNIGGGLGFGHSQFRMCLIL